MARDHARFQLSIWHDPDFRALPLEAQHAYMTVISQPGLSYVGVIDYIPSRIASLTAGHTVRRVSAAIRALSDSRFVIVDRDTAELLVRTYVKHDGVLDRTNMGKAVARAFTKVMSLHLRDSILEELAKVYRRDQGLAGWAGVKEIDADLMEQVTTVASRMASAKG